MQHRSDLEGEVSLFLFVFTNTKTAAVCEREGMYTKEE